MVESQSASSRMSLGVSRHVCDAFVVQFGPGDVLQHPAFALVMGGLRVGTRLQAVEIVELINEHVAQPVAGQNLPDIDVAAAITRPEAGF